MLDLRPRLHCNDADADVHADIGVGRAEKCAVQRDRLARVAGHSDPHEVARAEYAVGRVELDPARARQIHLYPGVGRAAARIAVRTIAGHEQISGHETRGDSEPPERLNHEQRVVPARARSGLQGIERMLGAMLVPLAIRERLPDTERHAAEDLEGRRLSFLVQEIAHAESWPSGSPYCG